MFDLTSVWLLMFGLAVFWIFWQIRRFAEVARVAAKQYCDKYHLQLLSTAMSGLQFRFRNGLQVVVHFELNYSADGLSARQGEIEMINGKINQISHWS